MRSILIAGTVLLLSSCSAGRSTTTAATASAAQPASDERCERARAGRARVDDLLAKGKLHRSVVVLEQAERECPAEAHEAWAAHMNALVELHDWSGVRALAEVIDTATNAPEAAKQAAHAGRAALETEVDATKGFVDTPESKKAMLDMYRAAAALIETKPDEAKGKFLEAWSLWRPNGAALLQAGLIAEQQGNGPEAQRLFDRAVVEFEAKHQTTVQIDATASYFKFITALEWTPKGRIVVLDDGVVRLLAQGSRAEVTRFGHDAQALCVDAPGDTIITLEQARESTSAAVVVWDAATGSERRRVLVPVTPIDHAPPAFACSASGDAVIAGASSVSLPDGRVVNLAEGDPPTAAAFFPRGDRFATARGGQITLWDTVTQKDVRQFPSGLSATVARKGRAPVDDAVLDLAISPDGKTIAAAGNGGVKLLSPEGRSMPSPTREPDDAPAETVRFAPDGQTLAFTASENLTLWPLTGQEKPKTTSLLSLGGAFGLREWTSTAFSPDGAFLAESFGISVALLTVQTVEWGPTIGSDPRLVDAASMSARGLILGATDRRLFRLDADSDGTPCKAPLAFSHDGERLLCGNSTALQVVDLTSGETRDVELASDACRAPGEVFTHAEFAGDDRKLVLDCGAWNRNSRTPQKLVVLDLEASTATRFGESDDGFAAISVAGNAIATGCSRAGPTACLWSLDGKPPRVLDGHTKRVTDLALTRDGTRLVTGSEDETVRLWDVEAASAMTVFPASGEVTAVAISPDGRRFAAAVDHDVLEWTTPLPGSKRPLAGAPSRRLEPGIGRLLDLAYDETGAVLIATGAIGARVWRDGSAVALVQNLGSGPNWIVLADDGRIDLRGNRAELESAVACRFGDTRYPFALCRERFEAPGLLREIFSGDTPRP